MGPQVISQTAEYALRAVVQLALAGGPLTSKQIAQSTRVPTSYLAKVLQALGRAGLVSAQRGPHGGFALVEAPGRITLLHVINAVDRIQRVRLCPLGEPGHVRCLCPLHRRLDDAMEMVESVFARTTIDELLPAHKA